MFNSSSVKVIALLALSSLALAGKSKVDYKTCISEVQSMFKAPGFDHAKIEHIEGLKDHEKQKAELKHFIAHLSAHAEVCGKSETYPDSIGGSVPSSIIRHLFLFTEQIQKKKDLEKSVGGLVHNLKLVTEAGPKEKIEAFASKSASKLPKVLSHPNVKAVKEKASKMKLPSLPKKGKKSKKVIYF